MTEARAKLFFTSNEAEELALLTIVPMQKTNSAGVPALLQLTEAEIAETGEELVQLLEGMVYEYEIKPIVPSLHAISLEVTGGFAGIVVPRKDNSLLGRIETGLHVGLMPLNLCEDAHPISQVGVEVRSSKADYRTDYQQMLEKIVSYSTSLVMSISAPAQARISADANINTVSDLQTRFAFLNALVGSRHFDDAIERIVAFPAASLEDEIYRVNVGQNIKPTSSFMKQLGKGSRRIIVDNPAHALHVRLAGDPPKSLPARINVAQKYDNYNVPENQFVKHVLQTFSNTLAALNARLSAVVGGDPQKTFRTRDDRLLRQIDGLQSSVDGWLNRAFFTDISDPDHLPLNSPTLQRKPGYREVLQTWLNFELVHSLTWTGGEDVFGAGKKDVARLYEYWLFIVFLEMLENSINFNQLNVQDLFEETANGLGLKLRAGNTVGIHGTYLLNNKSLNLSLFYNYTFNSPSSWSRNFRPDITICLYPANLQFRDARQQNRIAYLHFDAKYRVHYLLSQSDIDVDEERGAGIGDTYKRDDLIKMHAYKDAIKNTYGAYILYPGKTDGWIQFHENEPDIIPSVGALSILPSSETGVDYLKAFLDQVVEQLALEMDNQY